MTMSAAPEPPRSLLIACGALAREARAALAANGWTHVALACLPAELHNTPARIPEAVRARIRAARRDGFADVLCLYGDCGTGGMLDRVLAEENVARIDGPHCYGFYAGLERFAALHEAEPGTFYLTDFLVRHFERLVIRGLGLDRHPELRDAYFGHYRGVVYLAQTDDPALTRAAEDAAARLGLPLAARIATGHDAIADFIAARLPRAAAEAGSPWRS